MYVNVDGTRDGFYLRQKILRDLEVFGWVPPNDLKVDRSRQPEVQNLVGNVRGGEIESLLRKFLSQTLSEHPGELECLALPFLERNEDVPVGVADAGTTSVSQIDSTIREPNVIENHVHTAIRNDATDLVFNLSEDHFGLLDACSLGWQYVKPHLA